MLKLWFFVLCAVIVLAGEAHGWPDAGTVVAACFFFAVFAAICLLNPWRRSNQYHERIRSAYADKKIAELLRNIKPDREG